MAVAVNQFACRRLGAILSVALVALVACANKPELSSQAPVKMKPATDPLATAKKPLATGALTTIVGKAENARAGAVVLNDKGAPTYVEGLEEWDASLYGKRVRVTGKLVIKPLGPPTRNAAGDIQAGMDGKSEVLEDATWELSPSSSIK